MQKQRNIYWQSDWSNVLTAHALELGTHHKHVKITHKTLFEYTLFLGTN